MNAETERRGRSPVYGCYVNSLLLPDEIHYEPDEFFVAGELSHLEAIADVICWLSEMYNSTLLDFNSLSWESRHILKRFQLKRVGRLTIACAQQCRKRFPLSSEIAEAFAQQLGISPADVMEIGDFFVRLSKKFPAEVPMNHDLHLFAQTATQA
ncbi:MAG: hypothetical protein U0996_10655 [Planctomycetaceae bacterium]